MNIVPYYVPNFFYAQTTNPHTLDVTTDKPFYYLKGDTIQINAVSNISTSVTLRVYWNWRNFSENELIYENTKTTNATWYLPTLNQQVGFYRIVAETSDNRVTVWRTLIHATDYNSASLPFSHSWKGVNYTLYDRKLRAETDEDYIEISFPKIPFHHRTRFFRNNMTFMVKLDNQTVGWSVDLTYMTCHLGLKWIINGTLDNPVSFDMKCNQNPLKVWKRRLEQFKSNSLLTFDWSDLEKAKNVFSWNPENQTLHVEIPSSFSIDPTIFEDGFESGDFSAWTGTGGNPEVQSTTKHHGTYAMKIDADGEYAYKDLGASYVEAFGRVYVNFGELPTSNNYEVDIIHLGDSANWAYRTKASVIRTGGANYFRLWDGQRGGNNTDVVASLHVWHCVELKRRTTSGYSVLYINETSEAMLDYGFYDANRTQVGGLNVLNDIAYYDCVVVDDEYIGEEAEGDSYSVDLTWSQTVSWTLSQIQTLSLDIDWSQTIAWNLDVSPTFNIALSWSETISWLLDVSVSVSQNYVVDLTLSHAVTWTLNLITGTQHLVTLVFASTVTWSSPSLIVTEAPIGGGGGIHLAPRIPIDPIVTGGIILVILFIYYLKMSKPKVKAPRRW